MFNLSQLVETPDIAAIRDGAIKTYGVDIFCIYDLHTGKSLGTLDYDVVSDAIADEADEDEESLIDAMVTRTVLSMRPSPALNKPDRQTIRQLSVKRPIDCLAYMMNRFESDRKTLILRGEHSFRPLLDRIENYSKLSAVEGAGVDIKPWLYWLLELDAKMNLHDIVAPRFARKSDGTWTEHGAGESIMTLLNIKTAKGLLTAFESWVFTKLELYDKRDVQLQRESTWLRGNTFSQPAHVSAWLREPEFATRKAQAEHNKKAKAEKLAANPAAQERADKRAAAAAKTAGYLSLLESILSSNQPVETEPTPIVKKPALFRFGMLKKDS